MKRTFTLSILNPCHEKWEEFNTTRLGGFCSGCQKEVVDFTRWDEDRIKFYFKNRSQASCGRFHPSQLKSYTLQEPPTFSFLRWTFVSLTTLTLLLFSRNTQAQKTGKARIETVQTTNEAQPLVGDTVYVKTINGVVRYAEDQTTMPGVNVLLKRTAFGTPTDVDGRFSISISNPRPTDSLEFSFIGLETIAFNVHDSNDLIASMRPDFTARGEPVILGGYDVSDSVSETWGGESAIFLEDDDSTLPERK
jgi:hypothetical protein